MDSMMNSERSGSGPCSGLRVIEITTMIAGPMAGLMLADLGAEVIKIEAFGGDLTRGLRPNHKGMSTMFWSMNRHKKSIQIDLKSPEGQAIARRLAASADVLIENARPGVLDRLGLSYETLREQNPGLIYTSISGFGPDGPYARRPAFDHVIQGLTGAMALQNPLGAPEPIRNSIVDKYTATAAASAITAALLYRERSGGIGQRVSVSLVDAFASFALLDNVHNDMFRDSDNKIPYFNIFCPIRTADGHVIGHIQSDDQFARACKLLGCEELIDDPRFNDPWRRLSGIETMWAELERFTVPWATDDLLEAAEREGVPIGPVNSVEAFLKDPQAKHNRTFVEYEDPEYGKVLTFNYPARFEKSPANVEARPPKLGEHTGELLAELGMSADEIEAARAAGHVG
jgi:CoA:oxalate CoA-transferase